jgi:hypothetical protein
LRAASLDQAAGVAKLRLVQSSEYRARDCVSQSISKKAHPGRCEAQPNSDHHRRPNLVENRRHRHEAVSRKRHDTLSKKQILRSLLNFTHGRADGGGFQVADFDGGERHITPKRDGLVLKDQARRCAVSKQSSLMIRNASCGCPDAPAAAQHRTLRSDQARFRRNGPHQ